MKNLLVAAGLLLASCQNTIPVKEADAGQKTGGNLALVQQYFAHFNAHQWAKMASLYADSVQMKDPSYGTNAVWQTPVQIGAKYSSMAATFPDLRDSVVQMVSADGGRVLVEFISTGTAPDGSKFRLPIMSLLTVKNGRITEDFTYYDEPCEPGQ